MSSSTFYNCQNLISKLNILFSVDYASMYSRQYDNSPRFTEGQGYDYDEQTGYEHQSGYDQHPGYDNEQRTSM